ncbi:hypothetical protein [Nocardia jinanensis]|uniref:hypothetical protein n=1 Tax=Nocardia jinanensis TaxID=382504 RepID=UPI0007388714|nr:hypothetical protein [Nocardia jinanensis]
MSFLTDETIQRHGLTPAVAAAAAQERSRRHRELVAAAVADGRVPANRREFWIAQLHSAPAAETWLAQLAPAAALPGHWPGI